jgi:toluene monooxygenase system protein D
MGDQIEEIVAAIQDDNPDKQIEAIDRGSYVRVQTPVRMRLSLDTLRAYLGPDYQLALFSSMMPSFSGRMVTTSDELVWESIKTPRTTEPHEVRPEGISI